MPQDKNKKDRRPRRELRPTVGENRLEARISLSSFPPGQFPAGNPAQAPGHSNEPGNSGH